MAKHVLIVMPTVPFPPLGADEQNRIGLIHLLKELGYTVSIVAKTKKDEAVSAHEKEYSVSLTTVPYRAGHEKNADYFLKRLINPFRWDGAADEYFDSRMESALQEANQKERPAYAILEYSFLWPLARVFRKEGIPVIMRSHNFEPLHFLSEDGVTPVNVFKFLAKLLTEYMSCAISDAVFALTPVEARQFRMLGCPAKKLHVLHSGALPFLLERRHTAASRQPIELLFTGSRYSIPHNREAAEFLITRVMPGAEKRYPGVFRLSITGGKLPDTLRASLPPSVRYLGYVDDMESVYRETDIIISPHRAGHGMQLKVFGPLCRGIPVITGRKVLGGFPYADGKDILLADSAEEFVVALGALRELDSRRRLGDNARMRSEELFGKAKTLEILRAGLQSTGI